MVRNVTDKPKSMTHITSRGFFRCGGCIGCKNVKGTEKKIEKYVSLDNEREFEIRDFITCDSKNCVYLIECGCPQIYVGRTTRKLKERWGEHIRGIKKGESTHPLAQNFKEAHGGNVSDIKRLLGLKKIEGNWRSKDSKKELAKKEMEIIYLLNTLKPTGLNLVFELKWFLED